MKKFVILMTVTAIALIPQLGWADMMGQQGMMGAQPMMGQAQTPRANPGGFYCPNCGAYQQPGMMGFGYGMQPGLVYPGMMGNMMQPGRMYPGMMYPGMMGSMMQPGMMYPGMMGSMMQPGMMGYGYGIQPGSMYPGMMGNMVPMQPGMMGYPTSRTEPLSKEETEAMVKNHLTNFVRNPNLKLGKVMEKDSTFEVEIVTKDGSLVDRFAIDKRTGMMVPGEIR
jgi:hypothetical protein